jgi:hypothetical protein
MNDPTGFAHHPLWYAAWNSGSSPGAMFGDWSRSTFWQYTDHASIPGIMGNTDNNYFHGSKSDLTALAKVNTPVAAPSLGFLVVATTGAGRAVGPHGRAPRQGRRQRPRCHRQPVEVARGHLCPVKVGSAKTLKDGPVFFADKVNAPALYALRIEAGGVGPGSPVVLSRGIVVLTK